MKKYAFKYFKVILITKQDWWNYGGCQGWNNEEKTVNQNVSYRYGIENVREKTQMLVQTNFA